MTPQEKELVADLFDRLAAVESNPRDPEAERAIAAGLARAPHALYALVQTVLVQDEALKRANARIEELEGGAAQDQQQGSFLDSMRSAVFGERRGSVPSVSPASKWNQDRAGDVPPSYAQPGYGAQPGYAAPGQGGSFLGTAAAAAAGVIGGSLLFNGIRSLMGGGQGQAFAAPFDDNAGSPWGGGASQSDLAREAGINDIGASDAQPASLFDNGDYDDNGGDVDDGGDFDAGGFDDTSDA